MVGKACGSSGTQVLSVNREGGCGVLAPASGMVFIQDAWPFSPPGISMSDLISFNYFLRKLAGIDFVVPQPAFLSNTLVMFL